MFITRAKVVFRWVLILAILMTLAFIFSNSLKPAEESAEQSSAFGDFISSVIPPDTDIGKFVEKYIRKIAHFTEYGLLGVEVAVYVCLYIERRLRFALLSIPIPLIVGFIDETLQYIPDRGPAISDVWIDIGGYIIFSLITYVIGTLAFVIKALIERRKLKHTESENG